MNNHQLKNIIEEIEVNEELTLQDIAAKVKLDRSNLSTLLNKEEVKPITPKMLNKIKRHFPAYFKIAEGIQHKQHETTVDPLVHALNVIKEQNEWLRKLVDVNLAGLSTDVNNNAAAIRAEIRGFGKYQLLKESNWDDQEFLKAMAVVDKIYGEELKADEVQGNHNK
jgi:DNA-binding Xre family transcriptional regulator